MMSKQQSTAKSRHGLELIEKAVKAVDRWFEGRETYVSGFGHEELTMYGFEIYGIRILPSFVRLEVYGLSRNIREDDDLRNGDLIYFNYEINEDNAYECDEWAKKFCV